MKAFGFDRDSAAKIVKATKLTLGTDLSGRSSANPQPGLQCITASITSQDATDKSKFAWQQARRTTSGWENAAGGISGTLTQNPAYHIDPNNKTNLSGQHVLMVRLPLKISANNITVAWIILAIASADLVVKITSNASGGGKYNGRSCSGTSTASGSGNLSMPEGLTVAGSDDCIVLNLAENGLSTHTLIANSFHFGEQIGTTGTGLKIVAIDAPDALGAGTAQYQVLQMTSTTVRGWDFVRAH